MGLEESAGRGGTRRRGREGAGNAGRRGEGGKAAVGYIAVYINIGPQSMDYINMTFRCAFHIFHRYPPKHFT